ncbi:MAG: hypothetical protein OEZ08_01890 [Betaproteobacteria bacterium]|nr:hypothetical protein [Betaproteobacteria bacterium]
MKRESGIGACLEAFFVRMCAILGALLLAAGLALLLYQAYLYVNLGIWGQMPASSLFIESRIPIGPVQVLKDGEQAPGQGQLAATVRERIVHEKLYSVVPDWFRSKTSWVADPNYLYGLHASVIRLLDFLSLSVFLLLLGTIFVAVGLSESKSVDVPERREPTM